MYAKKATLIAATAALAEQALALNAHRHHHQHVAKRELATDWVTVWQTVYVTCETDAPAATNPGADGQPIVTSTSVVVVPTTEPVAGKPAEPKPKEETKPKAETKPKEEPKPKEAPKEQEKPKAPAPVYTTLATSLKAEAVPEPTTVVVEQPKAALPKQEKPKEEKPKADKPKAEKEDSKEKSTSKSGGGAVSSLGFSKRGIAYESTEMANKFLEDCPHCGWGYNWMFWNENLDSRVNYIPTLWGPDEQRTKDWPTQCQKAISGGSKAIFSFNEPDNAGQANLAPAAAAAAHNKWMNPYAGKVKVGSPSISNSGKDNEGLAWLSQFKEACKSVDGGCHYDFCNVHWYSEAQYTETLFEHLDKAHKLCDGKPVWLTEFAPHGSDEDKAKFMKDVIPRLEALDYLEAYSYFFVSTGHLMSSKDQLSSYGKIYASM